MPAPKELHPTSSLPELYGAKLRKLRIRAGWTQRDLGDRVPIAHSRIAQFELGKEIPPKDVSDALDRLLDADGDLCDLWAHVQRTPVPNWARRYLDLEPQAGKIRTHSPHTVHGLLQTSAYARALLSVARPSVGDRLEQMLSTRLARQAILDRPSHPVFCSILDESVLRRRIGSAAVMQEQLEHLLCHMSDSPHIAIQVLPFDAGEHPLLGGSLTVLSFPRRPDVAYLESSHSGELVENTMTVAEYDLAFDHLQAQALTSTASVDLIRSVMEETYRDARLPSRTQRRRVAQVQLQQHAGRRVRRGR
ncbi:helix-turn-helix domain-containing protein [Streptomyces beijiangensis]|uniref:Helix-turn-helix transcriptional regulator n=1 Tax=Streptomyces beijiangensis TaxID=163361 RepID=A0A939FBS9_9ACTN|nr:helix-turn-helix transcriptional regulator [Streptomyces beijiangensis]MBO0514140.1 helix-turn-helix transcriptional regulator [Streptomyces beijiangensis]